MVPAGACGGPAPHLGDTGSHYLLGYYTTNPKRDGKMRSIKVRLKGTGAEIRARRQYRAPSEHDIEELAKPAGPAARLVPEAIVQALEPLALARASTQFFVYGAVAGSTLTATIEVPAPAVAAGRWADGAELTLIAEAADGATVGLARGRLGANGRALIPVPLDGPVASALLNPPSRGRGIDRAAPVARRRESSTLVGDPQVYRSNSRGRGTPVASFIFARDERVRLDWRVRGARSPRGAAHRSVRPAARASRSSRRTRASTGAWSARSSCRRSAG